MVFCTLFDSNYLDKGLALYRSLDRQTQDFKLYVVAFDELAYKILSSMKLEHMVVIALPDMEDEALLAAKATRSRAEYCWTCTPAVIDYVLEYYKESACTYVDADIYFFRDPEILFKEIEKTGCSVVITEHRFGKDIISQDLQKHSGKYCVQFNMFKADERGRKVLKWWKGKCLEWCYAKADADRFGDQKYLDHWTEDFEGVYELENLGAGVAKWNLGQYRLVQNEGLDILLFHRRTRQKLPLIFYHFHDMKYLSADLVNIDAGRMPVDMKYAIYLPYLQEIEKIRAELLDQYQLSFADKNIKKPEMRKSRGAWFMEEIQKVLVLLRKEGIYRAAYKVWYRLWRNDKKDLIDLRALRNGF